METKAKVHKEEKPNVAYLSRAYKDPVNHPDHYNQIAGIECIDVIEHFGFNLGSAIKYLWRAEFKGNKVEDLEKARWHIEREIDNELRRHRDNIGP